MTRFESLLRRARHLEKNMRPEASLKALRLTVEHLAEVLATELVWMGKSNAAKRITLSKTYRSATNPTEEKR